MWLPEGADGRATARGITVDRHGRVYIAGGPNSTQSGAARTCGSTRRTDTCSRPCGWAWTDPFLNDVAIGPDGAAYFTNSNSPQVFRVAREHGRWRVSTWADATGTIPTQTGFNLGGIVVSPDRHALVVAQGNTGQLWRFDLRTRAVSAVDIGTANLLNADGLVLRGHTLRVVRNFDRKIATLRLDPSGRRPRWSPRSTPTPPASSPPPRSPAAGCCWSTATSTSPSVSRRTRSSPCGSTADPRKVLRQAQDANGPLP